MACCTRSRCDSRDARLMEDQSDPLRRLPGSSFRQANLRSSPRLGAHVGPEAVLTMVRRPQTVSVYSFNREQHDKFVQGEDLDP
jgi:hypothetical protein